MSNDPGFADALAALDGTHLRRKRRVVQGRGGMHWRVDGRAMLVFGSNDYLGLSRHPVLIEAAQQSAARCGVGSGGSALVSGHEAAHQALEQELAAFVDMPSALYFGSGYLANIGAIPALAGEGDAIFSDALNHASLIDGVRLSRAATLVYPHCDVQALGQLLTTSTARRKLVVTDAVFSMDGDLAPLVELLALCEQHDAWLYVDDAHGFGVLGPQGRGSAALAGTRSARLIYMATLGKAAGCAGAFVAGEASTIEWIAQRARSYVFATAMPSMVVDTVRASLKLIEKADAGRQRIASFGERLRAGLAGSRWKLLPSINAIHPLIVGDNASVLALMGALDEQGLWVPAIRPPAVPAGEARLRISLTAAHKVGDVDCLTSALRAL